MTADEQLMNDLVAEIELDWIDLGHAMAVVRIVEGGPSGEQHLLRRVGPLMVRLVREGRLIPGELGGRNTPFQPWPMSADAAADRIAVELEPYYRTGERVTPGDICWFTTPDDPGLAEHR